jgi:hypothetical protein
MFKKLSALIEKVLRTECSEPLHTKIHLILLLLWQTSCMGTIRNLWAPNIPESQPLFFGGRLVSRIFEEFQHPPQSKPK